MLCYTNLKRESVLELLQFFFKDVYLDGAPALRTVKKWFGRFQNGNFNLNNKLCFCINNDFIRDLVSNNPILTENREVTC